MRKNEETEYLNKCVSKNWIKKLIQEDHVTDPKKLADIMTEAVEQQIDDLHYDDEPIYRSNLFIYELLDKAKKRMDFKGLAEDYLAEYSTSQQ